MKIWICLADLNLKVVKYIIQDIMNQNNPILYYLNFLHILALKFQAHVIGMLDVSILFNYICILGEVFCSAKGEYMCGHMKAF